MERGRHMPKKIQINVAGLAFTVTNKYHTKDNLRSLQSRIIAHMPTQNNYYANLAFSCHTSPKYPPQKIFLHLKHSIHYCSWAYIYLPIFVELKLTLVILRLQKAAVPSGSCIAIVKFLECKLGSSLMYPCGTYVRKNYSTFLCLKLRWLNILVCLNFEVKMTSTGLASSYLPLELLPYYDTY